MHKINSLNHSLLAYTQEFLRWLFLHNLSNFSLTSLRTTCFLSNRPLVFVHVSRCLIYKVHAPTAERILDYHIFPTLSTLFLCFCNFSSLTTEEGKPLSESRPLFANRSYLSTPPELLQVLILYFSFFGQTAQSEPLMSVITAKNSRREAGKALLPPNI